MKTNSSTGLRRFNGLEKALYKISKVHSYRMDLGFGLGLLERCKGSWLEFHVDGSGYKPSSLSSSEWQKIAASPRFHLKPRFKKGGVFHSKAWFFRRGLLLGSCNLSIGEARQNLNFWCWIPKGDWEKCSQILSDNKSCTLYWDLKQKNPVLKDEPLKVLKHSLKGVKLSALIIITPQPPSKQLLKDISPYLSSKGDCVFFLENENHALKGLPHCKQWRVSNYVPADKSNGLHGKAFYGEWEINGIQGAVLYLGSANFTRAAYTGRNIESGIVIKAEGSKKVRELQNAVCCLLGRSGSCSRSKDAWATERFDGRWEHVEVFSERNEGDFIPFQNQEDIDLSVFLNALKSKNNQLIFPSKYGNKVIKQAELEVSNGYGHKWKAPKKRIFSGIVWSPDLVLKLRLKGGQLILVNIPPLEGLMAGIETGSRLLALLLRQPQGSNNQEEGTPSQHGAISDISIYSESRVLFPWQALAENEYLDLLRDRKELEKTLESVSARIKEHESDELIRRKLINIEFCIRCLLESKL